MDDLRYPIGKFHCNLPVSQEQIRLWIDVIENTPHRLQEIVVPLTEKQLDTPYRPDGWTVRQVIHHLPDSHMNAYMRLKLALTEDKPQIRPYREDKWAELTEARSGPIDFSLDLLAAVHRRWVICLRDLETEALQRNFYHPEAGEDVALDVYIGQYAWHCEHHLEHILALLRRNNWNEIP